MYTREITSEETYTLTEARRIIDAEKEERREKILYFLKQKIFGFLLIIMAVVIAIVFNGEDNTICLLIFPLGCYLLYTKGKVIY